VTVSGIVYRRKSFRKLAKPKDLHKDPSKDPHKDYVIGPALGRVRDALDITQETAAKEVGVHKMTLSEWERGNAKIPAEALLKLLPFYGLAFEDLPLNSETTEQIRQKVRRGTSGRVSEPGSPYGAGISFNSPIEAARSRVWLEGLLLALVESGADVEFLQRLETGVREILKGRVAQRQEPSGSGAVPSDSTALRDPGTVPAVAAKSGKRRAM
jgi:transcriptional regulator with XRE-family HTH domain